MISTFSNMQGIAYANYSANAARTVSSSGKLYVPVSPSMVGYTQFEHVRGVATDSGSVGVNISKIKILDSLIDRLVNLQQQPSVSKDSQQLSEHEVDALINDYQNKIKTIANVAKSNPYALGGGTPIAQPGVLFSIVA